jgi:hypothetical protein
MKRARAKLVRLQRLERLRAIAKHDAAQRAASAEDVFARIVALDSQTHALARRYETREECRDGDSLRQLGQFVSALRGLGVETARQIETARSDADARQVELAQAERRRSVVDERAQDLRRSLSRPAVAEPGAARRPTGTLLDLP